ncbi:MAG: nodulation protein NfeD [Calditrichaeota bacterium]|nr:MAG: nodulation protein NfeD [Calditrichota bacterium]MBL1205994.1 nodulation protein NfeD [Calditrichota bacterium]NOG45822.1 nodulation protein NfeD [Calditrichota bacterium]
MKYFFFIIFFLTSSLALAGETVHRIIINGVINPIATEYIEQSIERAEISSVQLLIIELDTPGGLMESMHNIMKAIQNAKVPVAVFVSPSGSRAGSAGVFITYSAHIAAMAPSTNIGSAHPVFGGGENKMDSTQTDIMMDKVTNDAIAKIKAVAERRGRNIEWAEKAVSESANITAQEALKMNVIDYIVPSADSLLSVIDGKTIVLDNSEERKMNTKGATIITFEMTWRQRLFDTLIDPNVAAVLMMIGMAGIMLELYNPGSIIPGVAGSISLIIAWYAMDVLPLNYAGLFLIVVSLIMFLLEIKVPSYGILTIGGVVSLSIGLIMLIDSPIPELQVSWQVIVGIVVMTTLFFVFALGFAIKAQQSKPTTGSEGLVGETGVVLKNLSPSGTVQIHGEIWKAHSDTTIKKGSDVEVVEYDGKNLTIKVKQV